MLRITKLAESTSKVIFRLEGRLVSAWVAELERECQAARDQQRVIELDFEAVHFLDRRALRLLENYSPQELRIVNCPALIRDLLDHRNENKPQRAT